LKNERRLGKTERRFGMRSEYGEIEQDGVIVRIPRRLLKGRE